MATQSILRNIVIEEPAAAEKFVTALENAADISEKSHIRQIDYSEIKGEEIKKFLGAVIR